MSKYSIEKQKEIIARESTYICSGNSIHSCIECGEPFLCYACPDSINTAYSQTMCSDCLTDWIEGSTKSFIGDNK
jgi:hypothetical protein